MSVIVGHDAIHANIGHLPPGQEAGYTTGTPNIRWTDADWAAHPGAVRICQDATDSDATADVLDVERYAATNAEAPVWARRARREFDSAARPGQREPAIYTSASNVTPLVNALIAGGVTSGVGLWVANWDLSQAQAYAEVVNAAGPFPIIGVQWANGTYYDTNVFSSAWLGKVSEPAPAGLTWSWWTTDGKVSLAAVSRELVRRGSPSMSPAHILRATCTKDGGHWDAQMFSWLNDVLGDPGEGSHTPIPAGSKLWVLQ